MEERMALTRPDQVKAVLHPIRQQILDAMDCGPVTPSEIARKIGLPANKVHYHVRILEKAGVVRLAETRQVGSVTETYFTPVAKTIEVRLEQQAMPDQASSYLTGELKELAQALRAHGREPRPGRAPMQFTLSRIKATPADADFVNEAAAHLRERFAAAVERTPGKEYRMAVILVPVEPEADGAQPDQDASPAPETKED